MPIWGWLLKLLSGFLPVDGKRIGKIIWVLVLSACAIGIYHKLFIAKSSHTTIGSGGTQIIYECPKDEGLFGVKIHLWKLSLKLGL